MSDSPPIDANVARTLLAWSGLAAEMPRSHELAEVFRAFHDRVERLYAVEVERFEFDFLHPLPAAPRR
jgi:hypothetical protein